MRRLTSTLLFAALLFPAASFAQEATPVVPTPTDGPRVVLDRATMARLFEGSLADPATDARDMLLQQKTVADWASDGRACEGCPRRRAAAA